MSKVPKFIERAIKTNELHVSFLKENSFHTIAETAAKLGRSNGGVSQDLTIAQWMMTHESELLKYSTIEQVLKFIKDKKQEMRLRLN